MLIHLEILFVLRSKSFGVLLFQNTELELLRWADSELFSSESVAAPHLPASSSNLLPKEALSQKGSRVLESLLREGRCIEGKGSLKHSGEAFPSF